MAQCAFTSGWTCPDCNNKFDVPGLQKDEIYIGNHAQISAYGETVTGEIDALTFDTYKGLVKVCAHKDTASIGEELVVGTNAGNHYTQTFTFRSIDDSTDVRNALEQMVGVSLVVIAKKRNGKYFILGQSNGLEVSENTKSSGATAGDDTGDLVTLTGLNLEKFKEFKDTDEATTKALLDSYLV